MDSINEVWESVCDICREAIHEVAFNSWIKTLTPVSFSEKEIVLKARSRFQKNIVDENYHELLQNAFLEIFGFDVTVTVTADDLTYKNNEEKIKEIENTIPATYTFDNFIVGPSNRFAHAGAIAVAKHPGSSYNPFFIYGHSGLGKTHLLNAIYNEIKNTHPGMNMIYTNGEAFTNEFIAALSDQTRAQFREKYRGADVLFIDDIHSIAGKDSTQEEFFNTFNTLHQENKQIVVTSDRPPKEIQPLSERVRSRFEMGLLADIQQPDFETRIAIVKRKAELINFEIPEEIVIYIADQLKNNVRQLGGAVNKLLAFSQLTGAPPTLAVAVTAISDIRNNDLPEPITVEKVISEVARYYNIDPEKLTSSKQTKDISMARHVAIYIARETTQLSLQNIGKEFGDRDHSTVHYSINRIEREIKRNSTLKSTVDEIIKNLNTKR